MVIVRGVKIVLLYTEAATGQADVSGDYAGLSLRAITHSICWSVGLRWSSYLKVIGLSPGLCCFVVS